MMPSFIEVDRVDAYKYLCSHLKGGEVSWLDELNEKESKYFVIVPDNLELVRLHDFERGGLSLIAAGPDTARPTLLVKDVVEEVSECIQRALYSMGTLRVSLRLPYSGYSDEFVQHRGKLHYCNDLEYASYVLNYSGSKSNLSEMVDSCREPWSYLMRIDSRSGSGDDPHAFEMEALMTTAYDGESFVICATKRLAMASGIVAS